LKAELIARLRNFFSVRNEATLYFNLNLFKNKVLEMLDDDLKKIKALAEKHKDKEPIDGLVAKHKEFSDDVYSTTTKLTELYRMQEKAKSELHSILSQCSSHFPARKFLPIETSIKYYLNTSYQKAELPQLVEDENREDFKTEFTIMGNRIDAVILLSATEGTKILNEIESKL